MEKFNYKKKYGQNFLIDNNILTKIADSFNTSPNDLIIEIGPGSGALTRKLKNKGSHLICFEIDKETKPYLDKLKDEKTEFIYEDILSVDLKKIIDKVKYDNLFIVGNLPYYITTKIITTIINLELNPKEMVFMVQKEVADRFMAKPKTRDYGYITVLLNYFYDMERVVFAPKECFKPMPKVDSEVVKFTKNIKKGVENCKDFNSFLKECFRFKRKKLLNNITNYNKRIIEQYLIDNNLSLNTRAEELSVESYIDLYKKI